MSAGLEIYDASGNLIVGTDFNVGLTLGSLTVGGDNQTQSGSFTDDRLRMGTPFSVVTSVEVNNFIGYKPTVTISDNTVSWSFPSTNAGLPYPRSRFIYGLR